MQPSNFCSIKTFPKGLGWRDSATKALLAVLYLALSACSSMATRGKGGGKFFQHAGGTVFAPFGHTATALVAMLKPRAAPQTQNGAVGGQFSLPETSHSCSSAHSCVFLLSATLSPPQWLGLSALPAVAGGSSRRRHRRALPAGSAARGPPRWEPAAGRPMIRCPWSEVPQPPGPPGAAEEAERAT